MERLVQNKSKMRTNFQRTSRDCFWTFRKDENWSQEKEFPDRIHSLSKGRPFSPCPFLVLSGRPQVVLIITEWPFRISLFKKCIFPMWQRRSISLEAVDDYKRTRCGLVSHRLNPILMIPHCHRCIAKHCRFLLHRTHEKYSEGAWKPDGLTDDPIKTSPRKKNQVEVQTAVDNR
jgi:hypothetical protein